MPWYCAKSIELYKYADADEKFPLLFDENLYLIEAGSFAEAKGRAVSFALPKKWLPFGLPPLISEV